MFYATPILYQAELFPESIRWILYLNPMTQIIMAYRNVFMYHTLPGPKGFLYLIILTILILYIGYKIFKKLERGFAEEV